MEQVDLESSGFGQSLKILQKICNVFWQHTRARYQYRLRVLMSVSSSIRRRFDILRSEIGHPKTLVQIPHVNFRIAPKSLTVNCTIGKTGADTRHLESSGPITR